MRRFIAYALTALCLTLSLSLPAKAVAVTVGGVTYEVNTMPGSVYSVVEAAVRASPWFGNQSLTESIADEFHTVTGGDYGFSAGSGGSGTDVIGFTFADADQSNPMAIISSIIITESTGRTGSVSMVTKTQGVTSNVSYAFGTIVATVPEINGASLAQALFVLLAFGLILNRRRPRIVA